MGARRALTPNASLDLDGTHGEHTADDAPEPGIALRLISRW